MYSTNYFLIVPYNLYLYFIVLSFIKNNKQGEWWEIGNHSIEP